MASHGVLENAKWFTIRFYCKLAIFEFMHKAYNGRLSSTLTNCNAKKRNLSYAIHSWYHVLTLTRFMKDSIAYRGTVLWNMLSFRLLTQAFVTL